MVVILFMYREMMHGYINIWKFIFYYLNLIHAGHAIINKCWHEEVDGSIALGINTTNNIR